MAVSKTILASASYITTTAGAVSYTFPSEPIVSDGRLVPDYNIKNPATFTVGTAPEFVLSNPQNDSNS